MIKIARIIKVLSYLIVALTLLVAQPCAAQFKKLGATINSVSKNTNNYIQSNLDRRPALRQKITRGINNATTVAVTAIDPGASSQDIKFVQDAMNYGLNPSQAESRSALKRMMLDMGINESAARQISSSAQYSTTSSSADRYRSPSISSVPNGNKAMAKKLNRKGVKAYKQYKKTKSSAALNEAIAAYLVSIQLDKIGQTFSNLGLAYRMQRNYRKALWAQNQAMLHTSDVRTIAAAFYEQGKCFEALDKYAQAATMYYAALRLRDPAKKPFKVVQQNIRRLISAHPHLAH